MRKLVTLVFVATLGVSALAYAQVGDYDPSFGVNGTTGRFLSQGSGVATTDDLRLSFSPTGNR